MAKEPVSISSLRNTVTPRQNKLEEHKTTINYLKTENRISLEIGSISRGAENGLNLQ